MSRMVKLTEHEYERAYVRWQYTPRWRPLARWHRRSEWKIWLRAMVSEIKREAS